MSPPGTAAAAKSTLLRWLGVAGVLAVVVSSCLGASMCTTNCQSAWKGDGLLSGVSAAPLSDFGTGNLPVPDARSSPFCHHYLQLMRMYPYQAACRGVHPVDPPGTFKKKTYKTTKPVTWYSEGFDDYFKIDADDRYTMRFTMKSSEKFAVTCYEGWTFNQDRDNFYHDSINQPDFQYSSHKPVWCVVTVYSVDVTLPCFGTRGTWLDSVITGEKQFHVLSRPGKDESHDAEGNSYMKPAGQGQPPIPRFDCPQGQHNTYQNTLRQALNF